MKKKWGEPRSRQDVEVQIPESYLAKDPETQERASTHSVMKCMRCMTACDKKRIKELLKNL